MELHTLWKIFYLYRYLHVHYYTYGIFHYLFELLYFIRKDNCINDFKQNTQSCVFICELKYVKVISMLHILSEIIKKIK